MYPEKEDSMAKVSQVPKHVTAQFSLAEVYDLILTLDAAESVLAEAQEAAEEGIEVLQVPESVIAIKDAFVAAYGGDLPGDKFNVADDEEGAKS
jgi:hypothetical protein